MRDYDDSPKGIAVVNFGNAKTGKTFFQLTMEKPMAIFETDVGSFDRARGGYEKSVGRLLDIGEFCREDNELWLAEDFNIEKEVYLIRCPFFPPDDYTGLGFYNYILAMNRMITRAIRSSHIKSIAIDTGTWFWQMQHEAEFIKVFEDARSNPARQEGDRQRLQQLEYRNPNARMSQIFREASIYGKNLLFTCHERVSEFKDNNGNVLRRQSPVDGWSQFEKAATIVTRSTIGQSGFPPDAKLIPQMRMFTTGSSLDSVNFRTEYPNWNDLVQYIEDTK